MISNYSLYERSKILEWLIEDYALDFLPYEDHGLGPSYSTDAVYKCIEENRAEWDN